MSVTLAWSKPAKICVQKIAMADQGMPPGALPGRDWLEAELADSLDEDFELDLEDAALSLKIARIYKDKHPDTIDRTTYSHVLIRLQSQLIKLQD
jgi:hypothetical protein